MTGKRLPAFEKFIEDLRAAFVQAGSDQAAAMAQARDLLQGFVTDDTVLAHSKTWPSTEGHKNLLLHEDEAHGFVINAVVRTSHRKRGIHDHAHAWTAYGLVDGEEDLARYHRVDDGAKEDFAEIELDGITRGRPGTVDLVPPFGIHAENSGTARSVAVIVRSERLVGKVLQGRYKPETNTTYRGEGPTQVPFELLEEA
jgi:predicted metal-dependent enzyme (double-stranded beta helix superfamily)